ncbi:nucleotidyltransferase family protein [Herbaspirillum sp. RTI4]|uniref:nucleotidyltransferase family protein n=1 Tax=Herbaspirillum sp. RTI4 TaxID=3048640 RepID=UPI002AB36EEB|nr:nucleotidyltransferase family protein [Herbaspirillum sp. RTI4]MDY7579608.1 nucleotidyltransferase family protein [Herbaspirillum sp. RTI4]MEA9981763.1 nucleotidyltransferase family protein [Herbaspirillum sp. RTI4]
MEAIVLAGGFGTRLRALVPDLPKPMAPVAGRPFLDILLASLARRGFTRVILSLGFLSEKISGHFGASYQGMELVYEVEAQPLGTGGAIRAALARCTHDHAFVFNGDTYLDIEADALEHLWQAEHHPVMVVREVPDTARFGRVTLQDGRVVGFADKDSAGPGLINAGCYVLPKNALDDFPPGQAFSMESDYFALRLKDVHLNGFITRGLFIDIGVPHDYALAQTLLAAL